MALSQGVAERPLESSFRSSLSAFREACREASEGLWQLFEQLFEWVCDNSPRSALISSLRALRGAYREGRRKAAPLCKWDRFRCRMRRRDQRRAPQRYCARSRDRMRGRDGCRAPEHRFARRRELVRGAGAALRACSILLTLAAPREFLRWLRRDRVCFFFRFEVQQNR